MAALAAKNVTEFSRRADKNRGQRSEIRDQHQLQFTLWPL